MEPELSGIKQQLTCVENKDIAFPEPGKEKCVQKMIREDTDDWTHSVDQRPLYLKWNIMVRPLAYRS